MNKFEDTPKWYGYKNYFIFFTNLKNKNKMAKKATLSLVAIEKAVSSIDAHVASFPVQKAPKGAQQAAITTDSLCAAFKKVEPIVNLLSIILGKNVGSIIASLSNGIATFCELDPTSTNPSDIKEKSKAVAKICAAYAKFSPIISLAIMLFEKKTDWLKALKGLQSAVETLCATPVV